MNSKLFFTSDYMEGCHPALLEKLVATNMEQTAGYGCDPYSESAREKIRISAKCPKAEIQFLVGGTQANATMIDAMLRSYQGVLAAKSGHVSIHEAGAIEFGGHKVLELPHTNGKITADQIFDYVDTFRKDANCDHMVMPGMVYISHPTEYGTLYSKAELAAISKVCHENGLLLYVDGARLAYALACPENDVTIADLAELCDVFYIGGTKCGALFGEAVVVPNPDLIPHLFTIIKQHGALLAKGRLSGVQFDTLFTDGLYEKIGASAIGYADQIRAALKKNGFELYFNSPTNQVFFKIENEQMKRLGEKVEYGFWEKADDTHTIIRMATSWATKEEDVKQLLDILNTLI